MSVDEEMQREIAKSQLQMKAAHSTETYKSLITISTEAYKAFQYLNGGALIALLTYLAHSKASHEVLSASKESLKYFIIGLVCASVAYLTAYATQFTLHNENEGNFRTGHMYWVWGTVILCIASLVCFGLGAFSSIDALTLASKLTPQNCLMISKNLSCVP